MPLMVREDPDAARYWRATVKVMRVAPGWLTQDSARQLTEYALLQARRDRLWAWLKANGETFESEFIHKDEDDREVLVKSRKRQPETTLLKETLIELRQLEVAMGLGSVYRSKVDLSGGADAQDDILED